MGRRTFDSDDDVEPEVEREEEEIEGEEGEDVADVNGGDDDEDDEEEEGQDEYEKDDFIVDEVEEEEEEEEERDSYKEERRKRKRKKKQMELDDEDYLLLNENNPDFQVPKVTKKFKRLKKAGRGTGIELEPDEMDLYGKAGQRAHVAEEDLFDGDIGALPEENAEEEERIEEEEEEELDINDEDEMADFIVEEDIDENGAVVPRKTLSKKKMHRAPGISSAALQEAHDIFGDVDELLRMRKEGLNREDEMQKDLEDEFEPSVLSEKYMTKQDNVIREIDVAERIQLLEEMTGPAPSDDESIEAESIWIHKHLSPMLNDADHQHMSPMASDSGQAIDVKDISNVLQLLHGHKLDIPFIAMYRKEECLSLLKDFDENETEGDNVSEKLRKLQWHKTLWAVQDLDRKWLLLQKQKKSLLSYYNKRYKEETRKIVHETRLNMINDLFNTIVDSLQKAQSEREVNDADMKFVLHFPPSENVVAEGQFKRPQRKSLYTICKNAGLWEVAGKFGFSLLQFGENLGIVDVGCKLEDAKETPEEIAKNFTCSGFETPDLVLKGARYMAALEVSCEPDVRRFVRREFLENAVVSTSPTAEGNTTIDGFHQYSGVKWLSSKPLPRFEGAQWLIIEKAEEEKLLQVTIELPEEIQDKILIEFNNNFLSDGVSRSAKLWNEQRKLILHDALSKYIFPSMVKEAREFLRTRAKNVLLLEYGKQLWDKVTVAPYQQHKDDDTSLSESTALRVMACCWGPGKPPTTFVMLDAAGEILDVLHAGSINWRTQNVVDQPCKVSDRQRLVKFMIDHQPQVIVLGATNLACTRLKDNIYEAIFEIMKEHPRDVDSDIDDLKVVYGEESLPRIYENSKVSSDQLPGQLGIVKRAAALGRYLQNPLAMVATLCGPRKEILSWKLSSMDHFLSADEKYGIIEQIMVDATNQVGIDVNLAASHEWLFAPLQFISGLGPRKASGLQRGLTRAGAIFSRRELVNNFMKKKVFINAAGFLRVRWSGVVSTGSHVIDLLDDSRIHPESYRLAKSMARAVCQAAEDVEDGSDDDDEMVVENVRSSDLLGFLDVEEYAKSYAEKTGLQKRETLYDIKMELLHGFEDWRKPYATPSQEEEFFMISGETDESLFVGQIVQATIKRVQADHVTCSLDSGLTGLIMRDDLRAFAGSEANDSVDIDATEMFTVGTALSCKVKRIQKDRYLVYLTSQEAKAFVDPGRLKVDPYYVERKDSLLSEKERPHKEKDNYRKNFKPRMIAHPRFHNWAVDEARAFLSDKEAGESVFRPSLNGPCYLTLTLKVADGVYADKDIAESGKDRKDITSLLRLGKALKIGDDTFEDLDEVMDRYVDPLVAHLKAMLVYRKFKSGTKADIDEVLRAEKAENPSRIVYSFGISHEHPGTFILSYIRSANPHHLYIGLYPKGLKFQSRFFDNIDRLVAYFQKHINDLGYEVRQSNIAASVPLRSPAPGGSPFVGGSWIGAAVDDDNGWKKGHKPFARDRSSTPGRYLSQDGSRSRDRIGSINHDKGIHDQNKFPGSVFSTSKWDGDSKDDGWGDFPGAKVQSSPGKDTFPGGWGGINQWGKGGTGSNGDSANCSVPEKEKNGGWDSNDWNTKTGSGLDVRGFGDNKGCVAGGSGSNEW